MVVPVEDHGEDGALVLAVQQGDAAAFDALFRRHYQAVRGACVRRLVDPVEADEVAQAAFVRAFERIEQCSGERRFGPWVHVIARSLCMDAFRARSRVEPYEQPLADGREQRPNEPEESLLRDERAAHVHQALAALPERQRSAVIARDWEELRPGEIADRLGVSIGAVDSLLLRARRRLARSYRRLAGEAGGGASTRTLRAAAAATAFAVLAGPHAVVAASASAADAVGTTASRAAVGVVSAVVDVAGDLGAPLGTPPPPAPDPPPTVVDAQPDARSPSAPAGDRSGTLRPTSTPPAPASPSPAAGVPAAPVDAQPAAGTAPAAAGDVAATADAGQADPNAPATAPPPVRERVSAALPPSPSTTVPAAISAPADATDDGSQRVVDATPPGVAVPTTVAPPPAPAATMAPATTVVTVAPKAPDATVLPPVTTPPIPELSRDVARP